MRTKEIIIITLFFISLLLSAATYTFKPSPVTIKYFAAYDSSSEDKAAADYICDETSADLVINDYLASVTTSGVKLCFFPGTYNITSTIIAGNGTDSAISTINGVVFEGLTVGSTFLDSTEKGGVKWVWTGAGTGPILELRGQGFGFGFSGIMFDCNNTAEIGVRMYSINRGRFTNFEIKNYTSRGLDLECRNMSSSSRFAHGTNNLFSNFIIASYRSESSTNPYYGLYIEGNSLGVNTWDWHQNVFQSGFILGLKNASSTPPACAKLNACDSNTFIEVDFGMYGAATYGKSVVFDGTSFTHFPKHNHFINCALISGTGVDPTIVTGTIGVNYFTNYGTGDGSATPSSSYLRGITDEGLVFNSGVSGASITNAAEGSTLDVVGKIAQSTTYDGIGLYDNTGGEITEGEYRISGIMHGAWVFDPKAVCDGAVDRVFLFTVGDDAPVGIHIDQWKVSFEADPTTEADLDLKRADAFIGVANAAVMDALDTTNGASGEDTDANINSGATVANGKVLYLEFGTAYTEINHQVIFEMWWHAEED